MTNNIIDIYSLDFWINLTKNNKKIYYNLIIYKMNYNKYNIMANLIQCHINNEELYNNLLNNEDFWNNLNEDFWSNLASNQNIIKILRDNIIAKLAKFPTVWTNLKNNKNFWTNLVDNDIVFDNTEWSLLPLIGTLLIYTDDEEDENEDNDNNIIKGHNIINKYYKENNKFWIKFAKTKNIESYHIMSNLDNLINNKEFWYVLANNNEVEYILTNEIISKLNYDEKFWKILIQNKGVLIILDKIFKTHNDHANLLTISEFYKILATNKYGISYFNMFVNSLDAINLKLPPEIILDQSRMTALDKMNTYIENLKKLKET